MNTYHIWAEGYHCTGDRSGARFICTSEGKDFKDACIRAHRQGKFEGHGSFDPGIPSLWACKLFDNETDARRNFG